MCRLITIIVLVIFSSVFFISSSKGEIIFEGRSEYISFVGAPITQMYTHGPSGDIGDFELFFCAVRDNDGLNNFNPATPNWDTLVIDGCNGGSDCILGIWNKFADSTESELSTCSWLTPSRIGFPTIFRYSGVDVDAPIITYTCNSDVGTIITAPSVITEAGSLVVRFLLGTQTYPENSEELPGALSEYGYSSSGAFALGETLLFDAYGEIIEEAGSTAAISYDSGETGAWLACTVAIRTEPEPPRPIAGVPALSTWAMVIMAGIIGISGLIAVRRSKLKS